MGKKIFFQKCNFNYIFFVFYMVFFFLNTYIGYDNYPEKFPEVEAGNDNYYLPLQILHLYITNLSNFLAIIPYFIRKRIIRKKEENIEDSKTEDKKEKDDDLSLIYNDNKYVQSEQKKKKFRILCIVVGILDFLQRFPFVLFNLIFENTPFEVYPFSCFAPFAIALQFVCCYYILKIHFYKLQYLSLFLNIGIFIIILIIDIVYSIPKNKLKPRFDPNLFYIYPLNIFFHSFELSFGKKVILEGFVSVYLLMIIKGSITLVFVIIFSLIILIAKKEIFSNMEIFFTKYIWLIFVNIITHFLEDLFLWLIIDRFSPNYNPFAIIFQEVSFCILDAISGTLKTSWDFYVRIFLYLISTIGVIIHNELVVINICELGSDTKYFLDKKFNEEGMFAKADNRKALKKFLTIEEMETKNEENEDSTNDERNNSFEN